MLHCNKAIAFDFGEPQREDPLLVTNRHPAAILLKHQLPKQRASESPSQVSRTAPKEREMTILSSLSRFAADYRAARARQETERSIRSLPAEIQKDIGWPEAYRHNTVNKVVTGGWY